MIGLGSDEKQPYTATHRSEVFLYTCFLKLTMQGEEELMGIKRMVQSCKNFTVNGCWVGCGGPSYGLPNFKTVGLGFSAAMEDGATL